MAKDITVEIDAAVGAVFPEVAVFAMRAHVPDQSTLIPALEGLAAELAAATDALASVEPITTLPELARWRTAYGLLGVKPSKFPSSIEALLRRAKKGQMAAIGIPAVDLYNAISVVHRVPLGAYDTERLGDGPLRLRKAEPEKDTFSPLGGSADGFPLNPALVVYAQEAQILCWGFNTRDSAETSVEAGSSDITFFSETTDAKGRESAEAALLHLATLIKDHGGKAGPVIEADVVSAHAVITPP